MLSSQSAHCCGSTLISFCFARKSCELEDKRSWFANAMPMENGPGSAPDEASREPGKRLLMLMATELLLQSVLQACAHIVSDKTKSFTHELVT